MDACCYILVCADGSLYTGWTSDLNRRLREHNAGRGSRYTRARRPVTLLYREPQPDSHAARRREAAIKRLPRAKKLALAVPPKRSRKADGSPASQKSSARPPKKSAAKKTGSRRSSK